METSTENKDGLVCSKCNELLVPAGAHVDYLSGSFTATLLRCPKCGITYVDEELAMGKILGVEETLEGK